MPADVTEIHTEMREVTVKAPLGVWVALLRHFAFGGLEEHEDRVLHDFLTLLAKKLLADAGCDFREDL